MKKRFSTLLASTKRIQTLSHAKDQLLSTVDFCKSMNEIKQAHAQMITTGLILHAFPASRLIKLLTLPKFASLSYAHQVFDQIPLPDLFIYNTLIQAHATTTHSSHISLLLFRSMLRDSCHQPNRYTFVFVFNSCCYGLGVSEGEQVRAHAIKRGFETSVFVTNVLIRMYAIRESIDDARRVFDWSAEWDLFSWNSMIGGYVGLGDLELARELFDDMPERDVVTWSTMIAGYGQVCRLTWVFLFLFILFLCSLG